MSNYPQAFIDDGYTRTVYFNGEEGVCPPFDFTFRPLVNQEAADLIALAFAGGGKDTTRIKKTLVEKISRWSFSQEVSVENLESMIVQVYDKIIGTIMGRIKPDREDFEQTENDAGN